MTLTQAKKILKNISYKDWVFGIEDKPEDYFTIYATFQTADACSGQDSTALDSEGNQILKPMEGKWMISSHSSETVFVEHLFIFIQAMEVHEAAEWFKYKGKKIFDPHKVNK